MNPLIPLIFIVLLAVIYAGMIKDSTNRLMALLAILVAVLIFCFVTLFKSSNGRAGAEGFIGGAPVDYVMGQTLVPGKADLAVGCDGYDYNQAGKKGTIIPKTGFYDGLVLDPRMKNKDYTLLAPNNVAYHSPVGDAYALKPDPVEIADFPTVDGQPGSPKQLSIFAYNNVSPYCCPSTYSSDRGCVCMTPKQYDFINRRGGQKSYNGNPDINNRTNQVTDFLKLFQYQFFALADMGACESRSASSVGKFAQIMPQNEINRMAHTIVSALRKRIPSRNDKCVINFIQEFNLNEMMLQNSHNVETLLAEVVSQFRKKDMIIVTWRDRLYPDDMPSQLKPAIFEILIYKRDLSISRL